MQQLFLALVFGENSMSHACQMQCSTMKYMNLEILTYIKKKSYNVKRSYSNSELWCISTSCLHQEVQQYIYWDLKNFNIPQNSQSKHHTSASTELLRLTKNQNCHGAAERQTTGVHSIIRSAHLKVDFLRGTGVSYHWTKKHWCYP